MIVCLGVFWCCGYFSVDAAKNIDAKIGYYGADLFSFIHSSGHSVLFPSLWRPRMAAYEGFSFLGVGFLLVLAFTFFKKKKSNFKFLEPVWAKRLFLISLILWIYSLGSNIRIFGFWIINLNFLYELFGYAAGAFRATGRFVWPMMYFIIIITMLAIDRFKNDRRVLGLVVFAVLIQMVDVSGIRKLSQSTRENGQINYEIYTELEEKLRSIPKMDKIDLIPPYIHPTSCIDNSPFEQSDYIPFALFALNSGSAINSGVVARKTKSNIEEYCNLAVQDFLTGKYEKSRLYILEAAWLEKNVNRSLLDSLKCFPIEHYYACYLSA